MSAIPWGPAKWPDISPATRARVARVLLVAPITPFMLQRQPIPMALDPAIRDLFAAAIEADYPRALRQFAPGFWGDGEEVSGGDEGLGPRPRAADILDRR